MENPTKSEAGSTDATAESSQDSAKDLQSDVEVLQVQRMETSRHSAAEFTTDSSVAKLHREDGEKTDCPTLESTSNRTAGSSRVENSEEAAFSVTSTYSDRNSLQAEGIGKPEESASTATSDESAAYHNREKHVEKPGESSSEFPADHSSEHVLQSSSVENPEHSEAEPSTGYSDDELFQVIVRLMKPALEKKMGPNVQEVFPPPYSDPERPSVLVDRQYHILFMQLDILSKKNNKLLKTENFLADPRWEPLAFFLYYHEELHLLLMEQVARGIGGVDFKEDRIYTRCVYQQWSRLLPRLQSEIDYIVHKLSKDR